jgi:hypothetical protein
MARLLLRLTLAGMVLAVGFGLVGHTSAQQGQKWVVSWTGSVHGPYPIGNPSAQPDQRFAFPSTQTGAKPSD